MPGFDGTGPLGRGPLTGRQMGYCTGARPGFFGFGRGAGRGFGRGLGFRRGFSAAPFGGEQPQTNRLAADEFAARIEELELQLEQLKQSQAK